MASNRTTSLRELLVQNEPVLAPGAYDALTARLIEAAGFPAVYMTGFGTAASLLGRPDVGLLGMSEMVAAVPRFGTLLAATRAIRELLTVIRSDGTPAAALDGLPRFSDFLDFIGLPEIQGLESRFSTPALEREGT
jgi:2-methylisocitrate lyase-like PEP mutase family enzyme